jgi:uncharacterized damage-inducible protein DinB
MQTEQAVLLLGVLAPRIEEENRATERVLAAIPEEQRDFRPHADARSAFELAWHIASSQIWYLAGIAHGHFGGEQERMPSLIKTVTDVASWWKKNVPGLVDDVKRLPPEQLARCIDCLGLANRPAVEYLVDMLLHTAHHRGQLSAYLRAVGAWVPAICGGSADEPFPLAVR